MYSRNTENILEVYTFSMHTMNPAENILDELSYRYFATRKPMTLLESMSLHWQMLMSEYITFTSTTENLIPNQQVPDFRNNGLSGMIILTCQ